MSTQIELSDIKDSGRISPTKYSKLKCCICIVVTLFVGFSILGFIFFIKHLHLNMHESNNNTSIAVPDNIPINYDYDYVSTNSPTSKPYKGSTNSPTSKPHKSSTNSPTSKPHKGSTNTPTSKSYKGYTNSPTSKPHKSSTNTPTSKSYKGYTNSPTSKPHKSSTNSPTNKSPLCNILTSSNLKTYPNSKEIIYYVEFNKTIMQPNYVMYIQPNVSNRCSTCRYFKVDPINTLRQNDYTNSGYDRGHLVPNADYGEATFIITNAVPMVPSFNRGVWKQSEKYIRDNYKRKLIYKGCEYSNKYVQTNKNKLYIPSGCYYVVFDSSDIMQMSGLKLLDYGYYKNNDISRFVKKLPKWIQCNNFL